MQFAENTQHDTSKALGLPRKMTSEVLKVLRRPRKMQRIVWKCRKSIAPATQNDSWHVLKHVAMSRSATPATRNEAMRRWRPPRVTPFGELTIGTAIRPSREWLRTAADGWATSDETQIREKIAGNSQTLRTLDCYKDAYIKLSLVVFPNISPFCLENIPCFPSQSLVLIRKKHDPIKKSDDDPQKDRVWKSLTKMLMDHSVFQLKLVIDLTWSHN